MVIDLSVAAAKALGLDRAQGHVRVRVEVLSWGGGRGDSTAQRTSPH